MGHLNMAVATTKSMKSVPARFGLCLLKRSKDLSPPPPSLFSFIFVVVIVVVVVVVLLLLMEYLQN